MIKKQIPKSRRPNSFMCLRPVSPLLLLTVLFVSALMECKVVAQSVKDSALYNEPNRPQLHFTPKAHWINDPNGLVYIKGTYHLFYQYYPKAINWGPMHWGHAVSKDLIHWRELPIALFPDSLGYIFSGSAVYDKKNTSGLGTKAHPPLVAIFTHHDPKRADAGKIDVERQSIAFSLDEGHTWTKYKGNPVVQNPGVKDFRDPKVIWYGPQKKWIMVVAASDRVRLYGSKNLTSWTEISQFGQEQGSHGSVWECPDLFKLKVGNVTRWVLTVCEGNGGPNKGSGVQYFVGDFNGTRFTSPQKEAKWLEYGPDDYAGNTWNGLKDKNKRIYIGWMTNLMYAGNIPATTWRGVMTLPRLLSLRFVNGTYYLCQQPLPAIKEQIDHSIGAGKIFGPKGGRVSLGLPPTGNSLWVDLQQKNSATAFELIFSSQAGDTLKLGLDLKKGKYYINRGQAGDMGFAHDMDPVLYAPKVTDGEVPANVQLVLDRNSIELFADNGLSVLTALYYPKVYFNRVTLKRSNGDKSSKYPEFTMEVYQLKSGWNHEAGKK